MVKQWASYHGHEGVVRLLLERDDVNPGKPDNDGRTPLWGASCVGNEGAVSVPKRPVRPSLA